MLASLVAVGGLWYTALQTQQANQQSRAERTLTKEAQITDRYTAAVNNLGDKKVDVRLGGVYALERIMQDSPRDHPTIANVLNTYARTHAGESQHTAAYRSQEKDQDTPNGDEKKDTPPADVQAALTVLVTRDTSHDKNFTLNFMNAQLANADLTAPKDAHRNADSGGRLRGNNRVAQLQNADLSGTDLREADLSGTDLREADLSGTDLREADLSGADLRGADVGGAILRDADLVGADLREADLRDSDLRQAFLSESDLRGALLSEADLRGALLSEADLSEANREYAARQGAIT